jgi:excinuclease ABC subunit A
MKEKIVIKGAKVHNLKNINAELPKNQIITISGVSGSGKSSLAFDTIFAEDQRRYIESLSPYARQFLGQMDKPDVEEISGLSPAIAIDQKALSRNPRSIVGTLTEVYDYMRVLFARIGKVYCPKCGTKIEKLSVDEMVNIIIKRAYKNKIKFVSVLSPVIKSRKGEYYQLFYDFLSLGYHEAYIDSKKYSMHEPIKLSRYKKHNIDIVVDRTEIDDKVRLTEAIENALDYSSGLVKIIFNENEKKQKEFLLSSLWTCPKDNFSFPEIEPRLFSFNSPMGACPKCFGLGTIDFFRKEVCPICKG